MCEFGIKYKNTQTFCVLNDYLLSIIIGNSGQNHQFIVVKWPKVCCGFFLENAKSKWMSAPKCKNYSRRRTPQQHFCFNFLVNYDRRLSKVWQKNFVYKNSIPMNSAQNSWKKMFSEKIYLFLHTHFFTLKNQIKFFKFMITVVQVYTQGTTHTATNVGLCSALGISRWVQAPFVHVHKFFRVKKRCCKEGQQSNEINPSAQNVLHLLWK